MAEDCKACGAAATVLVDPLSGLICCSECGVVVDDEMLGSQHQEGLLCERGGTLVTGDKPGYSHRFLHPSAPGNSSKRWQAKKKSEALAAIATLASLLGLQPNDTLDVQELVSQATAGEWGTGRWIRILAAACVYLVVRRNNVPFTLVEIASAASCGVPELGRMLNRVLGLLEITLPQEDLIVFVERLMSRSPIFTGLARGEVKLIAAQCRVLLEWVEKWFITTGRHRFPVLAAAFRVVCEANQVEMELGEIAESLHAQASTSRKRYREILLAFVATVRRFPWGKAVNERNVAPHFGFLLRYLENRMKLGKRKRGKEEEEEGEEAEKKKLRVPPISFAASEGARGRRLGKIERALERISAAKRALAGGEVVEELRAGLDWEDTTIEYLLLRGVTAGQIEQGYYESIIAALDSGDPQKNRISEEELSSYIYTKDEIVELIRRVKLQNMLTSPWVS